MPKKQTLRQQLESVTAIACSVKKELDEANHKIALLSTHNSHLQQTSRRFDQLLEGMCMGMKEANLPRRSS